LLPRCVPSVNTRRYKSSHKIVIIYTKACCYIKFIQVVVIIFEKASYRIFGSFIIGCQVLSIQKFIIMVISITNTSFYFISGITDNRIINGVSVQAIMSDVILFQTKIRILLMATKSGLHTH